jgi:hypothetical protein
MRAALLVALLCGGAAAHAEAPSPSLNVWNAMTGRVNPLGLEDWLLVGLKQPLYAARRAATRDNWIWFGAQLKTSPSALKVGPHLELKPLSILQLRFTAELARWFGVFTTFQSFGSPLDDWSDSALYKLERESQTYSTTTVHFSFTPTLQVAWRSIVVRDTVSIDYWAARLRSGDRVFYEGTADTVLANNSFVVTNDADVLWRSTRLRLYAGLRYTLVQPFYPASAYRSGEPLINPNGQQRLVALGLWTFYHRPNARVHEISVVAMLGWYLAHRFRTGADVAWGTPFGLLSLLIETDHAL